MRLHLHPRFIVREVWKLLVEASHGLLVIDWFHFQLCLDWNVTEMRCKNFCGQGGENGQGSAATWTTGEEKPWIRLGTQLKFDYFSRKVVVGEWNAHQCGDKDPTRLSLQRCSSNRVLNIYSRPCTLYRTGTEWIQGREIQAWLGRGAIISSHLISISKDLICQRFYTN